MIRVRAEGDFSRFNNLAQRVLKGFNASKLDKYGKMGVEALRSATPKKSTETANAWSYKVECTKTRFSISFFNSNIQNGYSVAIMLEYGHATKNGGWVEGEPYIQEALEPVLQEMRNEVFGRRTK